MVHIRFALLVAAFLVMSEVSAQSSSLAPGFPPSSISGVGVIDSLFYETSPGGGYSVLAYGGPLVGVPDLHRFTISGAFDAQFGSPGVLARDMSRACVADVDGDGQNEILIGRQNSSELYLFDDDGQLFPGWPIAPGVLCPFDLETYSLADIDGDGCAEVVTGGYDSCTFGNFSLHVINFDGSPVSGFPVPLPFEHYPSGLAVGDLEFDGDLEIVVSGVWFDTGTSQLQPRQVLVYEHDGSIRQGWPVTPPNLGMETEFFSSVAIGDIEGDGFCEIVGVSIRSLVALDLAGQVKYAFAVSGVFNSLGETVALADVDGDGDLEAVSAAQVTRVYDFTTGLTLSRTFQPGSNIRTVSIADLNGDGPCEFGVWISPGSSIALLDDSLLDVQGFPIVSPQTNSALSEKARVQFLDHDGDGDIELAYGNATGIHLWETPGEGVGRIEWVGYGGNPAGTRWYEEGRAFEPWLRGDLDDDGRVTLTDTLEVLAFVFNGVDLGNCPRAGDANGNGQVEFFDAIALLSDLFVPGSTTVAHPFPSCGVTPSDAMPCASPRTCP